MPCFDACDLETLVIHSDCNVYTSRLWITRQHVQLHTESPRSDVFDVAFD